MSTILAEACIGKKKSENEESGLDSILCKWMFSSHMYLSMAQE